MSQWSARVDLAGIITDDQAADLAEALEDHFAAIGTERRVPQTTAQLTVEAGSVLLATRAAIATVTAAARASGITPRVTGVEIITEAELDRRNATPSIPDLVTATEAAALLGVTRQRITELASQSGFPPAVGGAGRRLWVKAQVEAFNRRWDRKPGRPALAASAGSR